MAALRRVLQLAGGRFQSTVRFLYGQTSKYGFCGDMRASALSLIALVLAGPAPDAASAAEAPNIGRGPLLASDDFQHDLSSWVVEQQPGGTVGIHDGALVIDDAGGCTVWFRERLEAPVIIACEVMVSSASRVSDMNFFWMATDPRHPDDLFAAGHGRTGKFATYDTLRTYYVGYGGNTNTTTRFRRYDGTGARPLLPDHDLGAAEFLLQPDHVYRIELIAAGGHVSFRRDGEVIFALDDPQPLEAGWFGFRTVHSRIVVKSFAAFRAEIGDASGR